MVARKRVLLVDDDEDIREMVALLLGAEGYAVECARDGHEALERLRDQTEAPQVVLLDLMMPRLDGVGFLEAMRKDPTLPHLPVVIMSGHNEARNRAAELKVAGCLVKPVELADLLLSLQRF